MGIYLVMALVLLDSAARTVPCAGLTAGDCRRRAARPAHAVDLAGRRGRIVLALIGFPFFAKAIGDPALITLATRMAIYAIAAASLNLILGYGGLVSFGHAAFFGVGGYVVGILYSHFVSGDPLLGFLPGTDQLLVTLPLAIAVERRRARWCSARCRCAPAACNSS